MWRKLTTDVHPPTPRLRRAGGRRSLTFAFFWIKASVDAPAAKPSGCPRPKAEPRSGRKRLREACPCWSVVLMDDWCQCQEVSLLSISMRQ